MQQSPSPHVIRLRDPWERRILKDTRARAEVSPSECEKPSNVGCYFLRRFGLPTGLQALDRIDLVLDSTSAACRMFLNGTPLGEIATGQPQHRFPITNLLQNRNQLVIEFDSIDPDASIHEFVAEVRLEIFGKA